MKLSERLAEPIIAEAFDQGAIMSSKLSERLIRERAEAADLLEACEWIIEWAIDNDVIVSQRIYHAFGSLLKRLQAAQEEGEGR